MRIMARTISRREIPLESGNRGSATIDDFPDTCPWCNSVGTPTFITAHSLGDRWDYEEVVEAVFKCPKNECGRFYLAYYTKFGRMDDSFFLRKTRVPYYWEPVEFSEHITKISEGFTTIYNQAYTAEGMKLTQICGAGYRKALEFLIKDYLISKGPEKKEEIKSTLLGPLIKGIENQQINTCAKRAAWLGNDETHYERVWEDKDIENLKELIQLTRYWIEGEVITAKYQEDMPESGDASPNSG